MFSYKAQVDDAMDEDTVSLPHQQSFSSLKTDSDYIYQVHTPSIHIPLYDSQALKSSKQGTSLYSLTSAKDPKNSDSSTFGSPIRSYRSTTGIRSFDRDLSTEKGISELANYPLIRSDPLSAVQKSVPDLRFSSPSRKAVSVTHVKYDGPSSVSNLLFSPDTASNFLYKPKTIDSNVNLYSQTSSLEGVLDNATVDHAIIVENIPHGDSNFSEIPQAPALENSLQSILESGTHEIETEDIQESRLKISDDLALQENAATVNPSYLMTRLDTDFFKICSDDMLSSVSNTSNITQQLLPRSSSSRSPVAYRKTKYDSKGEESGGLSDYLLSITSPKFEKHKKNKTQQDPDPSQDSDTQTESL